MFAVKGQQVVVVEQCWVVCCSQDNRQTSYVRSIARTVERDRSYVLDSEPNPIQMPDVRMPD